MLHQAGPQKARQMPFFRGHQNKKTCIWSNGASCSATPHCIPISTHAAPSWAPRQFFQRGPSGQNNHAFGALEPAVLLHPMVSQDPPMLHRAGPQKTRQIFSARKPDRSFQRASGRQNHVFWEHWSKLFCYIPWHYKIHPRYTKLGPRKPNRSFFRAHHQGKRTVHLEHRTFCYTLRHSNIHPCYTKRGPRKPDRTFELESQTDLFREHQGKEPLFCYTSWCSKIHPCYTQLDPPKPDRCFLCQRASGQENHVFGALELAVVLLSQTDLFREHQARKPLHQGKRTVFGALAQAVLLHPIVFQDPPMLHQVGPEKTTQMVSRDYQCKTDICLAFWGPPRCSMGESWNAMGCSRTAGSSAPNRWFG